MVVADNDLRGADMLKCASDRVQISHAVIDHGNPLGHELQHPFGRGADALQASIACYGHP